MTQHFEAADIVALATDAVSLEAARHALEVQSTGRARLPSRIDIATGCGFLRTMPAVLGDVMGLKVMTLVEGLGTRYLVLMYSVENGDLLATFDADELTRLRTAATTAVAGLVMVEGRPRELGLVGTGFEASGHVRALAQVWPLELVRVYSRSPENRQRFAERISSELGVAVSPVESCHDAVVQSRVVVLATKSTEPVICGDDLRDDAVVLSIGSTRPDLRELDGRALQRAGTLVVDDRTQVMSESGDVIDALSSGAIEQDRVVDLADAAADPTHLRRDAERPLLVFKSVGTALQDLALARAVYHAADAGGLGRDLGELTRLKPLVSRNSPTRFADAS